ncbi:unnamed protein product [Adineta steineri]|uniref:G-protein coupled receptors family 1 profile domain-containing protein n=1 Tax=Adineta steineri TaxID=433720 RepID=A0A815I3Z4_9BILA|nr:unnamed protein product [Adineta steineri]CAF1360810.1 unnamed protein product [Adineta steineri]
MSSSTFATENNNYGLPNDIFHYNNDQFYNYNVESFLKGCEKISIVNSIKNRGGHIRNYQFYFPQHHKNHKDTINYSIGHVNELNLTENDIEIIIKNAFKAAQKYVAMVNMTHFLEKKSIHYQIIDYTVNNDSSDADSDEENCSDENDVFNVLNNEEQLSPNNTDDEEEENTIATDVPDTAQKVDIPLHLQYFKTEIIRPTNSTLCLFWLFIDYGFYFINLVVLMWASFERHILIFHSSMMATQRKRFFIHYVPLFIIVSFLMIFYGIAIFSPPCQNTFDFTNDLCGMAGCYGSIPSFALIERIAFAIIPMFLIIIFNIGLLVRIVWQKHRLHRPVEWQKQKKLAVNLVSISLVYLCFDGPLTMINLVRLCGKSSWASDPWPIFFYISYFPILLLPMVCLGSSSELRNKLIPFHSRQHRRVAVLKITHHT